MFANVLLSSLVLHLVLFIHSSIAVWDRLPIAPGTGVIAKMSRKNFQIDHSLAEGRKKNPFVIFLNTDECLELVPYFQPFMDDPYFVAFSNLNLEFSVEIFMGSTQPMGVLLRRLKLVAVDGVPPCPLQLPLARGTCLPPSVFDVIYRALLFADQRRRAPRITDLDQLPQIPAVQTIDSSSSTGKQPIQFREGMIGTASPANFQETQSRFPLPWARNSRFPLVLIMNKDLWCLEVVPDSPPFQHSNYFVSFSSLGLGPLDMDSTMWRARMGVLLRWIKIVPVGGQAPVIKPVRWLTNARLPNATFNTIGWALMFMDKYGRKPTTKGDLDEMRHLVSNPSATAQQGTKRV